VIGKIQAATEELRQQGQRGNHPFSIEVPFTETGVRPRHLIRRIKGRPP
jgi:hypothetical protein